MATNGFFPTPRIETFAFGEEPGVSSADYNRVAQFQDRIQSQPLYGMVWCDYRSALSLTLALEQSSDNGVSDAYAGINMRYGAASVSTIVVPPGGRAIFTVETLTKDWLKLKPTRAAWGYLTLVFFNAMIERHQSQSGA